MQQHASIFDVGKAARIRTCAGTCGPPSGEKRWLAG